LNHAGDANEDDLIELIELDAVERFDFSTSFPLVQAQNIDGELQANNGDDDDGVVGDDHEEQLVDLSSALSLIEGAGGVDETDHLHVLNYHNSSRSSYTDTDVNVDAASLLMPELANATALDCGNYVDYDEFNMCLNNILSEQDNDKEHAVNPDSNLNAGKNQHHHQHQQWHDVSDVLSIVPLNNNLGLSFQEFSTESSVTADDRSGSSSSSQLA